MIVDDEHSVTSPVVRIRDRIVPASRWSLWHQRPSLIAYCLFTELLAVAATLFFAGIPPVRPPELLIVGALAAMGITQAELGRQVERVRRRVNGTPHINMTSVWTGSAVLLLPPALVAVLVAVLYTHLALRSWYHLRRVPAFRTVFNASLVILTCYAAKVALVVTGVGDIRRAIDLGSSGAAGVAVALVAYFVTGALLAVPGLDTACGPNTMARRCAMADRQSCAAKAAATERCPNRPVTPRGARARPAGRKAQRPGADSNRRPAI